MPGVQRLEVNRAEDGLKLFQFLERRLDKAAPRALIMKWARSGQLRVDGGRVKPFTRLAAGQTVRVPPFTPAEPAGASAARVVVDLDIVHEDDEVLVIAKPGGLPAQPGSRHVDSVQTRLKARYANADFVPNIVHRLDKDTSGLILAGKTYASVRRLADAFAAREVDKTYLAWVRGSWPHAGPIQLRDTLAKERRGKSEAVHATDSPGAKLALAEVLPLSRSDRASLLKVDLLTGRTHQIRVQLASRGHPILGDRKYGRRPHQTPLLLHAWRLALAGRVYTLPPPWEGEWRAGEEENWGEGGNF